MTDHPRAGHAAVMSDMPGVSSVALNPTTIMIAERIAKTVYAGERGLSRRGVRAL